MTRDELYSKLEQAQQLLSDVYHFACENELSALESQMSCADTCITEAFDEIECGETSSLFVEEYADGQPDEAQEWHDFDADC